MKYNLERINYRKDERYPLVRCPEGFPGKLVAGLYTTEHRAIWWLEYGELPPDGWHIHHINGLPFDNRIENLEAIPASEHAKKSGHIADKEPEAYIDVKCNQCNVIYKQLERTVNFRVSKGQEEFYCSLGCAVAFRNHKRKGSKNNYPENRKSPKGSGVWLVCKACSKDYKVSPSNRLTSKTCSKPCSNVYKSISRTGVKVPGKRKNSSKMVTLYCTHCDKKYELKESEVRARIKQRSLGTFCSTTCYKESRKAV